MIKPTNEQINIIESEGNLVITAKPGSGKTFTIVEKIAEISNNLLDFQGVIAISFTRKASQELEQRFKRKNVKKANHFFGTIDNFYISEIIIPFSKQLFVNGKPLEVKDSIDDYPQYEDLKKLKETKNRDDNELLQLLRQSLEEGLIFLEISGETALYVLNEIPQCLLYLKSRYTHIFIDEYQDCGEIQHKIFLKLVNQGIKGIAVGDLDQAIYAFSNRYSKFLFSLMGREDFTHLEITRNHRCHKSISDYSLELMGIPRQNIEEKRVFKVNVEGSDKQIIIAIEENLDEIKNKFNLSKNCDFAILCRNNNSARRASKFLTIENKLFVDTPLDRLNGKWANLFNDLLNSFYLYKINELTVLDFVMKYVDEELNYKNFRKGLELINKLFNLDESQLKKHKIENFIEIAELIYPGQKDERIVHMLKRILNNEEELYSFKPATENEINIMTLHKSKGLEFKCVFLMDLYKWILPPEHRGVTEEDYIQALNLHYVGVTRAIEACYIMQGTKRYNSNSKKYFDAIESPFLYLHNTPKLREELNW